MSYKVAVVGATGVVGKEMIETLEARNFPVGTLIPLASERSLGSTVEFRGETIPVQVLTKDSFIGVDFALFSAGGSVSKEFAPIAAAAGAIAIDNTSHFRMDETVPLVVPEVNAHAIKRHKGIIANPNCSTAQLVVPLKPLYDAYGGENGLNDYLYNNDFELEGGTEEWMDLYDIVGEENMPEYIDFLENTLKINVF
jgi:aspartate-semialdehyde dehydrogenase